MFTFLKWGCLGASFIAIIVASILITQASDHPASITMQKNDLGGLTQLQMVSHGQLNYLLKTQSATEAYPEVGAFFTTSLITYYQLSQIAFECDLKVGGHARYTANKGRLDKRMTYLRISGPVSIEFDSGYSATAQRIDINLKTGQVKPVSMRIDIDGQTVPVGSRKWQIH